MTRVKICGITNLRDARAAVALGADSLGFNFFVGSPRCLPNDAARAITARLPADIEKVGVFVNTPVEELLAIAKFTGLTAVQIHGDEDETYLRQLKAQTDLKIIKAVRVRRDTELNLDPPVSVDALLLDAHSQHAYGGTGRSIDLSHVGDKLRSAAQIYLAGGLCAANVAEAISAVRPYSVDVASGVESSPGIKDHQKMKAFISNARSA